MAMVFCRGCGKEIHETAVSCPHCGCQQTAAATGNIKSQSVAAVLAAFVGGIGIHRFYLRSPISGIFYILFCWTGIPGLIAFVETFIYTFMSQQSWARKYNNGVISEPVHIAIRILVLIFPVAFVAGILAAIAIPAYQSYRLKAEAAKSSVSIEAPRHAAVHSVIVVLPAKTVTPLAA
ncbi:TM2 domain-containing protein [Massilia sp. Root335]|uniref:TM2 domain-containing protein n=1 Tax=Massilia sp. Root335 TaxID=1736517 RepID=UPI0009EA21F4|nr:TM2 domain-containing protein [Massilia sp. Root335]